MTIGAATVLHEYTGGDGVDDSYVIRATRFNEDPRPTEVLRLFLDHADTLAALRGGSNDDDLMAGGSGNDTFNARGGDDRLHGGVGDDLLIGGEGNDILRGGAGLGQYLLSGGAGDDTIFGEAGGGWLTGDEGNDLLHAGNLVGWTTGESGHDSLFGSDTAADSLDGGSGNDALRGGDGADMLERGTGADTLLGEDGNDTLAGGGGNDRVLGGAGADTVSGGGGLDDLYGDAGKDVFCFFDIRLDRDRIFGFVPGEDRIWLNVIDGATFDPAPFIAGADPIAPTSGGAYILYNTTNGQLRVDYDSASGGVGQQFVAILIGAPTLAFTDLVF